jgi:putative phosphotransacetylase
VKATTSARHVHLRADHLHQLFEEPLTIKRDLYQPGYWASNQTVTVCGPRGNIENVRVLGPCRDYSQVELSATDCHRLGFDPCVRLSGYHYGTPGCVLVGPKGVLKLDSGVIVPWRHAHLDPQTAAKYGVVDKDWMELQVDSMRSVTFYNVVAIVREGFLPEVHLDTDEANCCDLHRAFGITLRKST